MKLNIIVLGMVILFIFLSISKAQEAVSVNWQLKEGQSPTTSGSINASDEFFINLIVAYDAAATFGSTEFTNIQKLKPEDNGGAWQLASTQNDNMFIQFSVFPKANTRLNISKISLNIGTKGTDHLMANFSYSFDTNFSKSIMLENNVSLPQAGKLLDIYSPVYNIDTLLNEGETLYFRVYPWNTTGDNGSTSKYVYIQDVTISGTVNHLPSTANALWKLTSETSTTPTTKGGIIAEDETASNQFVIRDYGGNEGSQRVYSSGSGLGFWPNESEQNNERYAQFKVFNRPNGSFDVDTILLSMGNSGGSNNLKASVFYSTNNFNTTVKLDSAISLPNKAMLTNIFPVSISLGKNDTLAVRVYTWLEGGAASGKYFNITNLNISGKATGASYDFPTVVSKSPTYISDTFVTSGGTILSDGGADVTSRGVCWNISGLPTINDNKTMDGEGSGEFDSHISGLTNSTTYYLRAYATNETGTAYGEEFPFSTLTEKTIPIVTTKEISDILSTTAKSGGNITNWGGDTISLRGICWNTNSNPTINDMKSEDGNGIGVFNSTLVSLSPSTKYYARAYAVNSIGIGYGEEIFFESKAKEADVYKVVAKDGSGDYKTVQEAFNSVPDFYTGKYKIFVKNGIYYEKLFLDRNKVNVILEGETRDSTILTYDDYAGIAGGTSNSYSVAIEADDFTAINITFRNTVPHDGDNKQAVALRTNGDRQAYYNCKMLGYQDTYYTWGGRSTGRIYNKNCFIEGTVDFIFGRDIVIFDSCTINIIRNGGTLTAAGTHADSKYGYVFIDCKITADAIGFDGNPITSFYLGRPWQDSPKTVFINCYEPEQLDPAGWLSWNVTPFYAEYNCTGPGYKPSSRVSWSNQLTNSEAEEYTIEKIFSKSSNPSFGFDWLPEIGGLTSIENTDESKLIPATFTLHPNYPNPFNPSTVIKYELPQTGKVRLSIYNLLGEEIKTLVNKQQSAGKYEINFYAGYLASGIYIIYLQADSNIKTRKILLLK